MRIFIAGATGVLGRRVVPPLIAAGHTVTAVARTERKAAALRSQGARPVAVDLFDPAAVAVALDGNDVVMNLATAIPPTSRMLRRSAWDATDRLRREASANLVDGALTAGAGRYVQEALAFMYADHGDRWIDEDVPLDPLPYAAAVLDAEAHAGRFRAGGGAAVVLRFGMFYAADSAQTRDMVAMIRHGLLPLPGASGAYQPWVHVDDAGAAVVTAVDAPDGTYHVVEDEPLTSAEHVALLGDLVGRRVRRPPTWLAVGPMALAERSQRVSNRRLRSATAWTPAYGRRRDGWAQVLGALAREPVDA
jgi:nucleoside-diphosphate-sugar epimerase